MRTNRSAPSSGHCRPEPSSSSTTPPPPSPTSWPPSPATPSPPTPGSSSSTPPTATAPVHQHCGCSLTPLPWTTTLSTADAAPEDPRLAPTPAVTLADRLGRTHLGEPWRQLLTEYDTAARTVRAAQRRHLALGWRPPTRRLDDPDHTLGAGIDDS